MRNIALIAVGAPLIALGAFGYSQMEPSFDYGDDYSEVMALKKKAEAEPCDKRTAVSYNEKLNSAGDYRGALKNAARFYEQCGKYPRLRWTTYHAHKSLSEYGEAVREATFLVENAPDDKDYWWWRGQAYAAMEDWEHAAHDFKQCMLIAPKVNACPFDLSRALEKLNKPCEAIFPIENYLHHHPKSRKQNDIQSRLQRLQSAGNCDARQKGDVHEVQFHPKDKIIYTKAKVNGVEGRFLIDTGASYVTVTEAFSGRLGMQPSGTSFTIKTATGLFEAAQYIAEDVTLGSLNAKDVEVAVMKKMLGDDIDGVLGLSFLSRFQMQMDYEKGIVRFTN